MKKKRMEIGECAVFLRKFLNKAADKLFALCDFLLCLWGFKSLGSEWPKVRIGAGCCNTTELIR